MLQAREGKRLRRALNNAIRFGPVWARDAKAINSGNGDTLHNKEWCKKRLKKGKVENVESLVLSV